MMAACGSHLVTLPSRLFTRVDEYKSFLASIDNRVSFMDPTCWQTATLPLTLSLLWMNKLEHPSPQHTHTLHPHMNAQYRIKMDEIEFESFSFHLCHRLVGG